MLCAFGGRAVGGKEAEKAEREKWINKERKVIQDSVDGESVDELSCVMQYSNCTRNCSF